jgi:hypothetical protein
MIPLSRAGLWRRRTAPSTKRPPRAPAACCRSPRPCPPKPGSRVGGARPTAKSSTPDWLGKRCTWPAGSKNRRASWRSVGWWSTGPRRPRSPTIVIWRTRTARPPSPVACGSRRSRWHVEQYFQRSKDDLGLDHYEGRCWRGFHHHLVLAAIAYLFILTMYLASKKKVLG